MPCIAFRVYARLRNSIASITGLTIVVLTSLSSFADQIDCGPQPTLACLAPHIFALAREMPEGNEFRKTARFAEEVLAPGSVDVALRYYLDDNPDPTEWDDIWWIARAGLFDRAIARAEAKPTTATAFDAQRRIGGLVAIAVELARTGNVRRAKKILRSIEPELTPALLGDQGMVLIDVGVANVWAEMGETERAIRLLRRTDPPVSAVNAFLKLAKKYPASAAVYRPEVWKAAERVNSGRVWRQVAHEAARRGDAKVVLAAVRRSVAAVQEDSPSRVGTEIVGILLAVGLRTEASAIIDSWRSWLVEKEPTELSNKIDEIASLLAELGRDAEVEAAVQMVPDLFQRSRAFGQAADRLFKRGQEPLAVKLENEAIAVADSAPYDTEKLQWEQDGAFHNLALMRASRGDFNGALAIGTKVRNGGRARELTFYIIESAITRRHGDAAASLLNRLQATVRAERDVNLLLKVADRWLRLGRNDDARRALADALTIQRDRGSQPKLSIWDAATLVWELDGNSQAVRSALDEFVTNDEDRAAIVEATASAALSTSLGKAVHLASEIPDPQRRLWALQRIATKLAESSK